MIKVFKKTKVACQQAVERMNERIKKYEAYESRLTDFDRFNLKCDKEALEKNRRYLDFMQEGNNDCIYIVNGTPIPHEVGEMLFGLTKK